MRQFVRANMMIAALIVSINVSAQSSDRKAQAQKGLSFSMDELDQDAISGLAHLRCSTSQSKADQCNPYQGDQLCETPLPILCFYDLNAPIPQSLGEGQYWSGGVIATTAPMPASDFKTVSDVHELCMTKFGQGWRIASFHDGGGWQIRAYGNVGNSHSRVWVDIKDQKEGTCWSR